MSGCSSRCAWCSTCCRNASSFCVSRCPDSVRHATRELPDTTEIELRAGDGTRLHGWLRHSPEATPPHGLLIYFGGNAEESSGHIHGAQAFAPWSVAAFNYRGYGRSEGRPSETALVADALVIHDHLAQREDIDPRRIVVFGRSLGSGVAVQLAAARPVRAVALVSPYDSLRSLARKQYPFIPVSLLLEHPFDSLARAPGIETPVLIVAGERDPAHPARVLETPARRLGRPEAMGARCERGSQRHSCLARILARDSRLSGHAGAGRLNA